MRWSRVEFDTPPSTLTRCWARHPDRVRTGGGDNPDCGRYVDPDDPLGLCGPCRDRITRGQVASWPGGDPEPSWAARTLQRLSI